MKIVITGCNGQLGSELQKILKGGRAEIGEISPEYKNSEIIPIDIDTLDISCTDAVHSFIKQTGADLVINCAAYTNVDGCETNAETAFKANAVGVRNLAAACEEIGAKFIHVSTDYVFKGDAATPYTEWDEVCPISVYGKSKALGEKYAISFCSKSFVVRTSWLYGYVGKNFVKTVRRVLREKGAITVVNDQRGNPTNANDLAYHLLKLGTSKDYGIYHCTGNGECTWYDFACEIARLSGFENCVKPCTSEQYPSSVKRPAYSSLNNMALACGVGDEMRNWQDAIKEYILKVED